MIEMNDELTTKKLSVTMDFTSREVCLIATDFPLDATPALEKEAGTTNVGENSMSSSLKREVYHDHVLHFRTESTLTAGYTIFCLSLSFSLLFSYIIFFLFSTHSFCPLSLSLSLPASFPSFLHHRSFPLFLSFLLVLVDKSVRDRALRFSYAIPIFYLLCSSLSLSLFCAIVAQ